MYSGIPGTQQYKAKRRVSPAAATMGSTINELPGGESSGVTADLVSATRQNMAESTSQNRRVTGQAVTSLANAATDTRDYYRPDGGVDLSGLLQVGTSIYESIRTANRERSNKQFVEEAEILLQNMPDIITKESGGTTTAQRKLVELLDNWSDKVDLNVLGTYLPRFTQTISDVTGSIQKQEIEARKQLEDIAQESQFQQVMSTAIPLVQGLKPGQGGNTKEAMQQLSALISDAHANYPPLVAHRVTAGIYAYANEALMEDGPELVELKRNADQTVQLMSELRPFIQELRAGRMTEEDVAYQQNRIISEKNLLFATPIDLRSLASSIRDGVSLELRIAEAQKAMLDDSDLVREFNAEATGINGELMSAIAFNAVQSAVSDAEFNSQWNLLEVEFGEDGVGATWMGKVKELIDAGNEFREEESKEWETIEAYNSKEREVKAAMAVAIARYDEGKMEEIRDVLATVTSLGATNAVSLWQDAMQQYAIPNISVQERAANRELFTSALELGVNSIQQEKISAQARYVAVFQNYRGLGSPELGGLGWLERLPTGRIQLKPMGSFDEVFSRHADWRQVNQSTLDLIRRNRQTNLSGSGGQPLNFL